MTTSSFSSSESLSFGVSKICQHRVLFHADKVSAESMLTESTTWWFSFVNTGLVSSHHFVLGVSDELLK